MKHVINIDWKGPFKVERIINDFKNGGNDNNGYDGPDYGLYQIYGQHDMYFNKEGKSQVLLYIGQAAYQTFSKRFGNHKEWLKEEYGGLQVYLGRLVDRDTYKPPDWEFWYTDVDMAESILIYKYTPCYNGSRKASFPKLRNFDTVELHHSGQLGDLGGIDRAPRDYRKFENLRKVEQSM